MTIKVLIYLSLVALCKSSEYTDDYDSPAAYSSVYTSFGSHITEDDDGTFKEAKTNSPILEKILTQSAFVYETTNEQLNNNGGTDQQRNTATAQNNAPQIIIGQNIMSSTSTPKVVQSSSTATPSQPMLNVAQIITIQQPVTSNSKLATNPPLSSAIIGEGRLLTPGLSAYASSGDESDNGPAKITIVESTSPKASPSSTPTSMNASKSANNSQKVATPDSNNPKESFYNDFGSTSTDSESNESFDGFGPGYSW